MKREACWGTRISLGLLHVGALIGLTRIGHASAKVWVLAGVLWLLTGFGVTVGYHRMETHGGFKAPEPVKWTLFALGAMTMQGQVHEWVLNHRAHHKYQDVPGKDPHSPREFRGLKGLAWAHVGWLLYKYERPGGFRRDVRMEQDRVVAWHKRHYWLFIVASLLLPAAIAGIDGWSAALDGFLVAGLLRIVFGLHATWSVNSVCHWVGLKAKDSFGNKYQADDSRNNWLVALVAWGEGYHANHHAQPAWAYHDWKWYNLDPSKWLIRTLELLRLAKNVKKPEKMFVFKQSQLESLVV